MRIVCPECRAEYTIPSEAIPAGGREVQCSTCAHSWYQLPVGGDESADQGPVGEEARLDRLRAALGAAAAQSGEPATEAPMPPRPSAKLDPGDLAVLKQEAAREARARRAADSTFARQPDLDLRVPPKTGGGSEALRTKLARLQAAERAADHPTWRPGEDTDTKPSPSPSPAATIELADTTDRTPRSNASSTSLPARLSRTELALIEEQQARREFRMGFAVPVGAAAGALALYIAAPWIAQTWPVASPVFDAVAQTGDRIRDTLAGSLRTTILAITSSGPET